MNSLLGYGSDDELDDSPEEKCDSYANTRNYRKPGELHQDDTNYDEVQMSLSEDSDTEAKNGKDRETSPRRDKNHREDSRSRNRDDRAEESSRSRGDDRLRDKYRDRERSKDGDRSRDGERSRDEKRARSRSRERYSSRDDRYRRDRKRSRSRDRKRSRSPRRNERSRSRSRSRDRSSRGYSKKYDRFSKADRYDRGTESKLDKSASDTQPPAQVIQPKDRFFMPGITGRFRDQIEKRKLLWQKNKEPEKQAAAAAPGPSQTTKVWQTTTFAQDNDGKVANKFKRLMGIRSPGEGTGSPNEVLKKQEEMFTSMEAQYEVARTATHTMRGVGLGFGSYQR